MFLKRAERGAAAVELALLMPLLLLILFALIDFGRMFHAQVTLTQASREGARLAALGYDLGDVVSRSQLAATGLSGVAVDVTECPGGGTGADSDATVRTSHTFVFATPLGAIGGFFGGGGLGDPIPLSAKGVMPCET